MSARDDQIAQAVLPVGFARFHRRAFINYQLNRAHALGHARADDLRSVGTTVRTRDDCVVAFAQLSADAANAGRLRNATTYLRLAEFFTPPRSAAKVARYGQYRELFDVAFADSGAVRHDVPYENASIPAYRLGSIGQRAQGTVLLHGGFDSLIEEFISIWQRLAAAGFDVVAFEGPGQGGARALSGLTFDHDWEKPVAAVLDHFAIDRAGLVGISMGGYWALRAAGREPRIDRVVSWPPVYDWLHRVPPGVRLAARVMLRRRRFMRWNVRIRTRLVPTLRHVVDQALYLVDSDDPMDAVDWFLGMNADHLASQRVTQDVLLLCGEHDKFQPPVLTRAQARALTRARTVSVRTFTAAEHADQHCQMGNLALACDVIADWLARPRQLDAHSLSVDDLPFDARERLELCALLDQLGPSAPTLLTGWTAHDLTAHIVLRERDLIAAPCIVLPGPFQRFAERRRVRLADLRDFAWLIARIRSGPPAGFFRIGWVRSFPNLNEFFVHHEDVRRANGLGPRALDRDLEAALWRNVRRGSRFLSRRFLRGAGLEIEWAGTGQRLMVRRGEPTARLTGTPGELLLYVFGRQAAAHVEVTGAAQVVQAVHRTHFGM